MKQPWLIDGETLEKWLEEYAGILKHRSDLLYGEGEFDSSARIHSKYLSVKHISNQVQSGQFNVKEKDWESGGSWLYEETCARCGINKPHPGHEWCLSCRPELEVLPKASDSTE